MEESETASKAEISCALNKQAYTNSLLERDLNKWGNWATTNQQSLAVFRIPGESPKLIIDNKPLQKVATPIEELKSGFLFANFEGNLWHIDANQVINFDSLETSNVPDNSKKWKYYSTNHEQPSTSKESYISSVQQVIDTIKSTSLVKAVPTKIKLHSLPNNFSLASTFVQLCETYPSAFISIVSTKEFGTWLTATPELLINVDANGIFETMALAGTQNHNPKIQAHDVAWVDKDIEEQAMVNRYIINRFKEIRLRDFEEKGPFTLNAANLTHLCTTYKVDTKATGFQDLGGLMLNLLHPTSAVCGMPKEPALKLIDKIEAHDRKFYTGYLGPVNMDNKTSIFVNLRCMEIFKTTANLFAGAGVTAMSKPEKEWDETELKLNTLLNIIG